MDTEILIFMGAIVGLSSLIWGILGYVYRDDADSPARDEVPAPPPPSSSLPVPAPRLRLQGEVSEAKPSLSLSVVPAIKVLSTGYTLHGVRVMCKGAVPWRQSGGQQLVFDVVDLNQSIESPVYSVLTGYSNRANGKVRYVSPDDPPRGEVLQEWTELVFLPTSFFIGPKSGQRDLVLRCRVMVAGGDPDRAVQVAAMVFKANLELPGYRDDPLDRMIIVCSRIVELAMACAAADGVSDADEKRVIREWIEDWSRRVADEGSQYETRFRGVLMAVLNSEARKSFTLDSAVTALFECTDSQRMEALALCVRVISVDGVLHEKEMQMIEKLSDLLEVDRSVMRSLFDKQFARSGIVVSPDNLEAIVGVDPAWDKEQIRKHLAQQFMKWNSRAPAAKTVEDQARIRAMLDAIAKLRQKYA